MVIDRDAAPIFSAASMSKLADIINDVRTHKKLPPVSPITPEMRLREDLSFDSMDLAELTVRIEEATGVDVFADGLVSTVGEILARIAMADDVGRTADNG
jgi:acyl carrier protein